MDRPRWQPIDVTPRPVVAERSAGHKRAQKPGSVPPISNQSFQRQNPARSPRVTLPPRIGGGWPKLQVADREGCFVGEPPDDRSDQSDWVDVIDGTLSVDRALAWASLPSCGAVVTFSGTVRDHSPGRIGVTALEFEVFAEEAVARLGRVASSAREQWADVGRLVLLHRTGRLVVGDTSVVVVVSTPHRAEAFDAARYCIDTLKRTVPVWKRETWADGTDWGLCAHDIENIAG